MIFCQDLAMESSISNTNFGYCQCEPVLDIVHYTGVYYWWNELEFEFEVRLFLGVRVRLVRPIALIDSKIIRKRLRFLKMITLR